MADLRIVPLLLRMVWETSTPMALTGLPCPAARAGCFAREDAWVSKLIVDRVVNAVSGKNSDPSEVWVLLGVELGARR